MAPLSARSGPIIKIGCCGFGGSMSHYYEELPVVEIQNTFYQPPKLQTLEKWRADAPEDFEFTIKAFQMVTHESGSPTYRRLKRELTAAERNECGGFKPTQTVQEAWKLTRCCAEELACRHILFQCPASFTPTRRNIENLRKFFGSIKRPKGMRLIWEPRGDWSSELVSDLCTELKLVHAVDPFTDATVTPGECYFRLHGKSGWRYVYTDEDLVQLKSMLPKTGSAYVFFNNVSMRDDARRFIELLKTDDAVQIFQKPTKKHEH